MGYGLELHVDVVVFFFNFNFYTKDIAFYWGNINSYTKQLIKYDLQYSLATHVNGRAITG